MTDKKKLHQILSSLWKNNDSVGKTYYNQALQDVQTAVDLQEEPVSEDLEEAAKNHAAERYRVTRDRELAEKCKWSFKAGAKWQEKQDQSTIELAEDHAYFAGSEAMREKILKEIEEAYKKGGVIEAMKIIRELKK